jgi:hypothetical protein
VGFAMNNVITCQVEVENLEIHLERLKVKDGRDKAKDGDRASINLYCALNHFETHDDYSKIAEAILEYSEVSHVAYSEKIKNFFRKGQAATP